MHPLRIEHMTVFDIEPADLVTLAADLGIPMISFFATKGLPDARPVTAANKGSVLERLRDAPVKVDTVEVFILQADADSAEAEIALAAELGASSIVALNLSSDVEEEAAAQLARLCTVSARYGLLVSLEPISMGVTRTIAQGERLVRLSGAANARLTIDLLHVMRTGTPLAEIARLDASLVGSAQICDGAAHVADKDLLEEAAYERKLPGDGTFPLADFLRVLPPHITLGMEIPLRSLRQAGVSALERTLRCVEQTRAFQELALADDTV